MKVEFLKFFQKNIEGLKVKSTQKIQLQLIDTIKTFASHSGTA